AALAREAVAALVAAGRADDARRALARLLAAVRAAGRFRLLESRVLLALGQPDAARAVFEAGFEVADLREGDEALTETWAALTDDPLPEQYEFRMRPS
ncbi:tetratricopeptide repeat protein, partial [Streptomyces mayteni]